MKKQDIRWVQRFQNFEKAFKRLEEGVELATERELRDIEKEGVIQRFEYTQELAWKTIKDFYEFLGETGIQGSRDAFKLAFERGLIINSGQILMDTIKSRNDVVHGYDEDTANKIFYDIKEKYYDAFKELLESLRKQKQTRKL